MATAKKAAPAKVETEAKAVPSTKGSFELKKLGAKPEPVVIARQSRKEFIANLITVAESPGEYFEVAQYAGRNGAQNVVNSIQEGKQALPPVPEGYEWDIEAQLRPNPNGVGRPSSVLVAALVEAGTE